MDFHERSASILFHVVAVFLLMDRLELAERQLDRIQAFHPRIDARIAAVSAWLLVEIGIIADNTKLEDIQRTVVWLPLAAWLCCVVVAGIALWRALFPDQRGGAASLIYFARIADRTEANFIKEFKAISEADLTDDFLGQVWRNAEIVCDKYRRISRAIHWATFSLGAMLVQVIAVSVVNHALPIWKG